MRVLKDLCCVDVIGWDLRGGGVVALAEGQDTDAVRRDSMRGVRHGVRGAATCHGMPGCPRAE